MDNKQTKDSDINYKILHASSVISALKLIFVRHGIPHSQEFRSFSNQ